MTPTTPQDIHQQSLTISTANTWAHYTRTDCGYSDQAPHMLPWAFPVSDDEYPIDQWYCASVHDPTGRLNAGYRHTGLDINLRIQPRGDIERRLGLSIYAIAEGTVHFVTDDWFGVPMIVIRHQHQGRSLYVRYGHITPIVSPGSIVSPGDKLGGFANWRGGDHLHFDMSYNAYTTEWFTPLMLDPAPILKAHLNPSLVDMMLRRG